MSLLEAMILAILQGIMEFLPVSSYGQLLLAEYLMEIPQADGILFEILLHIGSAMAVSIVFRKDIVRIYHSVFQMMPSVSYNIRTYFYNLLHEQEERKYFVVMKNNYQKLTGMLLISVLSSGAVSYLLHGLALFYSKSHLNVGLNFLVTAVVLIVVDLWKCGTTIPDDMNIWQAMLIGACHGLGVFPGISSLGITIAICLLCGLRKNFAVRYSFLLFIPISLGALFFQMNEWKSEQMTLQLGTIYIVGMIIAAIAGLLCARVMLKFLTRKRLRIFAIYSLLMGIFAIILNFM